MIAWLDRIGTAAVLLSPLVLLHGRGLAEATFAVAILLFLARSALLRDWSWLRTPWLSIGLVWWAWLVLCSALAQQGTLGQAVGVIRFLLLPAALEHWILRPARVRLWLARLVRWSAFYIAAQCALQFVSGRNLFGMPRGMDGELTGPYQNPRAAGPLSLLLFPTLLPLSRTIVPAVLMLGAGVVVMVLIGQRMPLLLTLLGLVVTALLLPRLRGPVLFAGLAAGLLLAALPSVSPQAAQRLETKFTGQMANFSDSHYGQIAARALSIAASSPVTGTGFDGFRLLCEEPRFFGGWHGGDGGGAAMCVQHPHNFYLQAVVEGGVPGLVLFTALSLAWLAALGRDLRHDPSRVGLFVAALIHLWPLASTNALTSMPTAGWFSVLLGLGLAEARAYIPPEAIEV